MKTETNNGWIKFLNRFPWQVSATLSAQNMTRPAANKAFQAFCRSLAIKEGLWICGAGVYNYKESNHIHALLLGGNRHNIKLNTILSSKLESYWHQDAQIIPFHDNIINYIVWKNTPINKHIWLDNVGQKRLKTLQHKNKCV